MVYKSINNQSPEYSSVLINRVSTMTSKTLRNANLNLWPAIKHHIGSNFFTHSDFARNNQPTQTKAAKSLETFNKKLKKQKEI